jgi:serine/threonine protein phosphatase 1
VGNGTVTRFFAIGDVHGCLPHLETLMERIRPLIYPDEDTIVFLGDYVDRGPDPKGVVDYLLRLREEFPGTVFLKGNHEDLLLDWHLHGRNYDLYLYNGGSSTIRSYSRGGTFYVPPEHLDFFTNLRPYYETSDYVFVHAGLRPGIALEMQDQQDLMWIRDEFIYAPHSFGKMVIFGHTPYHHVFQGTDKIGIDTGAVYGGKLTCVALPDVTFYRVGLEDLV